MMQRLLIGLAVFILLLLNHNRAISELAGVEVTPAFVPAATPGFGDRYNSTAWSMIWWKGKLYVGTLRSFVCWRAAIWASTWPALADTFYPPGDADADCTDSPADLLMQAEIWRWTPENDTWERVYQSPQDVPIPGYPGKFVARDTGFRGMLAFTEADGTEALYVTTVSPREMYGGSNQLPPPRILRSTDGVNFEPIPQDPGTFMANLSLTSLRSGTIHNGRMYLSNGTARGEGVLIEAQDPAGGNNNFREVMPPGTTIWDAISFNGFLYVGVVSPNGFSVVKTDATGEPPYTFTQVISAGGYLLPEPSQSIVSFHVYQDRLYVGTFDPAELYRINPDDTWELLIGEPRQTPAGMMYPLSGLESGFGWPFNVQIYRMHSFDGVLYLGTLDVSRELTETFPGLPGQQLLSWHYGFDLYQTTDGQNFEPLTINGFDDQFQIAVRTFATTPHGLFLGTGSYWYGLNIWQYVPQKQVYLPMILTLAQVSSASNSFDRVEPLTPIANRKPDCETPLQHVMGEKIEDGVLLSWDESNAIGSVRVYRSDLQANQGQVLGLASGALLPAAFVEIGQGDRFFFVDTTATPDQISYYYVVAEGADGCLSRPSNLVRVPSLAPPVTFKRVEVVIRQWPTSDSTRSSMIAWLTDLKAEAMAGDASMARRRLENGSLPMSDEPDWRANDLRLLLMGLERRLHLVEAGLLAPLDLD